MTYRFAMVLGALAILLVAPQARAFGAGLDFDPVCWATGVGMIGDLPGGDFFWGFAASDNTDEPQEQVAGHWLHWTPPRWVTTSRGVRLLRDHFAGRVEFATCSQNGTYLVTVQGRGTWNGAPDHLFQVVIQDRFDPTEIDFYGIVILGPDSKLVYEAGGDIVRGGIITSAP